ncbi:hypothetical protein [Dyella subtropica]|uniref:hypothetical protein n=1 Tax=Dyella subtropica TaxID=2992127 RepID=UPI0022530EC1|nr:hypothetical protein [Dyella subtropica]
MPEKPNIEELPISPVEGHSHPHLPFGPRPPIAELPWAPYDRASPEALAELFRLRDRVHTLESQALAGRLKVTHPPRYEIPAHIESMYRGDLPNELPEGGEGGGGVYKSPWHINELPPPDQLLRDIGALVQRLLTVETQLAALKAKIETVGAKGNAAR